MTTPAKISEQLAQTKSRLRLHEGVRNKPYQDTVGVWTIGIGRNLEANPLEDDVIELMFQHDWNRAVKVASSFGCWAVLDEVRRGVLVEMAFQLGPTRLRGFRLFLAALQRKDWAKASAEMLDSKWARQVPKRARSLAKIMETGVVT